MPALACVTITRRHRGAALPHQQFAFHPEPVTALAKDFTASAGHLDGCIGDFAERAENVDDSFGVLSESTGTLSPYVEMTRHTTTALQKLSAGLRNYAAGLHHNLASYQDTESARAQQFGDRWHGRPAGEAEPAAGPATAGREEPRPLQPRRGPVRPTGLRRGVVGHGPQTADHDRPHLRSPCHGANTHYASAPRTRARLVMGRSAVPTGWAQIRRSGPISVSTGAAMAAAFFMASPGPAARPPTQSSGPGPCHRRRAGRADRFRGLVGLAEGRLLRGLLRAWARASGRFDDG